MMYSNLVLNRVIEDLKMSLQRESLFKAAQQECIQY